MHFDSIYIEYLVLYIIKLEHAIKLDFNFVICSLFFNLLIAINSILN